MAIIGLQKGSGKRSRVREKSVKSQGILIRIMSGNPVWEPVINISWLKNEQVKVCFFTLESPYQYFCCNLRHNVMPYMYSEMQNKLSKIRESPLESMGQIISSQCPIHRVQVSSPLGSFA